MSVRAKQIFMAVVTAGAMSATRISSASAAPHSITTKGSGFEQLSQAAGQARDQDRDEDAIHLYQRALALRPSWQEGLWYLGTLFYQKGHYAEARDVLRRFVAYDANTGPGWALLGMSEFQTREYPRALDHLQRAMALGMGDRKEMIQSVFYFVAVLLTRLERYDDSMNLLFKMIASGDEKLPLTEPVGLAALRMPILPPEISADRRQLVQMAGEASFVSQTPHFKDADGIFKNMEAAYPDEPGVHFLYGAYLMDLRPEDGVRELERELEISPSHVPARLRLAAVYVDRQEFDKALALAEQAIKLDPGSGAAHMILGEVHVGKGNLAEGIKELEVARDKQPLIPRTHWDLLRAYTAAGRTDDAKREKEAIEKLSLSGSAGGTAEDGRSSEQKPPN